jgi:hypothetical protein
VVTERYVLTADAYPVGERDTTEEIRASGFRVMVLGPGTISAFDLDGATAAKAQTWAEIHRGSTGYALAARVDGPQGVTLVWLTQPPEELF